MICVPRLPKGNACSIPTIILEEDPIVADENASSDLIQKAQIDMLNDMNHIKKELFDIRQLLSKIEIHI